MLVASVRLYIQKLKTILPFKIFIFFLVLFSFFTSFIRCNYIFKTSIYNGNEELITGTIIDYKILDTKYKMTILTNKDNISEKVIASIYLNDNDSNLRKKVSDFKIGDRIILKGNLNKPLNNTIPNTFNYQKYLYYQKIYYLFTVKEIISIENSSNYFYQFQDFLYKRCEMIDEKGYLTMLIYGKKNIDADTYSYLQDLGVVHLFAISGLHISIFTMLLEVLLKKIKKVLRNFIIIIFLITFSAVSTYLIYEKFSNSRDKDYDTGKMEVVFHDKNVNEISLNKFTPIRTSNSPSLKSLNISTRSIDLISLCKYLTLIPSCKKKSVKSSAILLVRVVIKILSSLSVRFLISVFRS